MRQNYETSKLYYGFPVILLGHKDANFKYNFTTNSSSYTLGDMMVIGFHSRSNAAKQITNFKEFTVNVPSENLMNEIEIGGFFHKADKIPLSKLEYEIGEFVDAPLFTACPISIECKVENIVMYGETANVIASIKKRIVNSNLIEDGKLNSDKLNPVIFLGDEHERIYRYLRNLSDKAGKFYKNQFE
ncbi:Flavin reductase like domain protein [Fusobacterium nucleatum]|uniref:flavin reductase n=1 Tax=Fusobacterium nucleatum TaxID=851 RepID=UPI001956CC63|nr:flavin reductase [Fusobacterium nucleatum]VTX48475.1 Flavin reductase like domain protein [Fusobacterium nucleatum]